MPSRPLVLGFDTSAVHCAAALLSGDTVVAAREEALATGQAERLLPMLEQMLASAGCGWRDLTALGVGIGPGNFTGIRISVAAARGLALSLAIPAIGVDRFQTLALGLPGPLVASVDARRGQVWLQVTGGEPAVPLLVDCAAPPPSLADTGLAVVGASAAALAGVTGGPTLIPLHPPAVAVARIACARHDLPQPRPAPLYLRSADAAIPATPPLSVR